MVCADRNMSTAWAVCHEELIVQFLECKACELFFILLSEVSSRYVSFLATTVAVYGQEIGLKYLPENDTSSREIIEDPAAYPIVITSCRMINVFRYFWMY